MLFIKLLNRQNCKNITAVERRKEPNHAENIEMGSGRLYFIAVHSNQLYEGSITKSDGDHSDDKFGWGSTKSI